MFSRFFSQAHDGNPKRLDSEATHKLLKAYASKWVQETRANQMLEETMTCINALPVLASCYPDGNDKVLEDSRNRATTISHDLEQIRSERIALQAQVNALVNGNKTTQELLATWIIHTCDMAKLCYLLDLTQAKVSQSTDEPALNENKALLDEYKKQVDPYFDIVPRAEQALYAALGIHSPAGPNPK